MSIVTGGNAEIKLALFRYIDSLNESNLTKLYNRCIVEHKPLDDDFWSTLSVWEQNDIEAGIADLNSGNGRDIQQVLSKY